VIVVVVVGAGVMAAVESFAQRCDTRRGADSCRTATVTVQRMSLTQPRHVNTGREPRIARRHEGYAAEA
jgi:hypothetical protein